MSRPISGGGADGPVRVGRPEAVEVASGPDGLKSQGADERRADGALVDFEGGEQTTSAADNAVA